MDKREQDRLRTQKAILDAAEDLMSEDGYAAVTSRRVGERAGLKSQLVHYHFGTMDELFQAAFRRSDKRFFEEALKVVSSKNPLQQIWHQSIHVERSAVIAEYVAAANHRKVLQDELVQSWSRFRSLFNIVISAQFKESGKDVLNISPLIMNFLVSSVGKSIIEEASLGYTEGHEEVIAFMDDLIGRISGQPVDTKVRRRKGGLDVSSRSEEAEKPLRTRSARSGKSPRQLKKSASSMNATPEGISD